MRSLLNTFMPYLRDVDRRALPPYQNFLQQQKKYTDTTYFVARNGLGHETQGMQQLRYILNFVDMEYLLRLPDHYKRYTNLLCSLFDSLIENFDRANSGDSFTGYYIDSFGSPMRTKEYVLPVSDINCIVKLPMYSEEWERWKFVRPLRLWTHDSNELTTEMTNTLIEFHNQPPSYAFFTLDVIGLILKYVTWYQDQRQQEFAQTLVQESPQQYFLHRYVFTPLIYDLTDIWLLKQFNKLTDMTSRTEVSSHFKVKNLQTEVQYGYVAGNCTQGFEYIWNIQNQQNSNIRPECLLSSRILLNSSLHQRMRYLNNNIELPEWDRYDWCRFMRDYDIIVLFLKLWQRRKDLPTANKIFTYALYDLRNFIRMKPWRWCLNLEIRTDVEQRALELELLLDNYVKKY